MMNELRWTSSEWKTKMGGPDDKTFPNPLCHNQCLEQTCMPVPAFPSYCSPSPTCTFYFISIHPIKEGRKQALVNRKQHFGLGLYTTDVCKEETTVCVPAMGYLRHQFDKFAVSESEPGLSLPTCWRQWFLLHPKTNRIRHFGSAIWIAYISDTTSKWVLEIHTYKCHVNAVNMQQACQ